MASNSKRRSGGRVFFEDAVDGLYSLFERYRRSIGGEHLSRGDGGDSASGEHLGCTRRLISMGGKGARAPREYKAGFGWHTLFLYVALPLVLGLLVAPRQLLEQIPGFPRIHAPLAGGDVIVISPRGSHRDAVVSTAQPRGYSVTAVSSAAAGTEAISNSANLRFVVIDRDSAATPAFRAAVQEKSQARIVLLPESATAAEIANQLIQAGLR